MRSIDYLSIHHYYGLRESKGEYANLMARPLVYERFYRDVGRAITELAPGRDIRLIINEWNTSLPVPRQHSMESALYGARLMNVFERSGDLVEMTAVSDLVNGWSGGIIQASRHDVFVTPTYLVIRLYNETLGRDRLAARVVVTHLRQLDRRHSGSRCSTSSPRDRRTAGSCSSGRSTPAAIGR